VKDAAPQAEILSQGEELLQGEITDSNAAWLSQRLVRLGFDVVRHTAVGDRKGDLVEVFREIAGRSRICIGTGGLGPTCDDWTAHAFAEAFSLPLELDMVALDQIEDRFRRLGRGMPPSNRRQAYLPAGAERLDNHWGTAPGFRAVAGGCCFTLLPGVPEEMRQIYLSAVEPELRRSFRCRPPPILILRTMGVGESQLEQNIASLGLPAEVGLGFRAAAPVVDVKLHFPAAWERQRMAACGDQVQGACGDGVVGRWFVGEAEPDPLQEIGTLLMACQHTVAALEGVSAGAIARLCQDRPWFLESLCGRPERLAEFRETTPSVWSDPETLVALAEQHRQHCGADYLLAQFAGAGEEVEFVLIGPAGRYSQRRRIGASGSRCQEIAAAWSLEFLRRELARSGCRSLKYGDRYSSERTTMENE